MSGLLDLAPFGARDDVRFLAEMTALTRRHLAGCAAYARMWSAWNGEGSLADLPFVHAGIFKRLDLRTESEGLDHQRTLQSSSTSGAGPSRIALDAASSELQRKSSRAILADFVGEPQRPLLILDSVSSLRRRGDVPARVAGALSLQPFSSDTHFVLAASDDAASVKWDDVADLATKHDAFLVYGFTWMLWLAWGRSRPASIDRALANKTLHFVHSGGWKKLDDARVDRARFDQALLRDLSPESRVIDFYGLVEQVGVIYPLCDEGYRHAPVWADVLVRDALTLDVLEDTPGLLQLMNITALGAPYHNVLTEDVGRLVPGACACGRGSRRFELIGRVPKAEIRGCANV